MTTVFRNTPCLATLLAIIAAGTAQAGTAQAKTSKVGDARRHLALNCPVKISPTQAGQAKALSLKKSLKIGFIGDSITCGYNQVGNTITPGQNDVAALTVQKLSAANGATIADNGTPWNVYDKGVSATSTADWQPGPPQNLYETAKAAFVSSFGKPDPKRNPVWVFIMLGTNDVRSDRLFTAAQHEANLRSIVGDLVASGFNVMINHAPSFVVPTKFNGVAWDAAAMKLLQSYLPGEKAISADFAKRVPGRVFLGDTMAFSYFAAHPALFQEYGVYGGLHPNGIGGTEALADCWARAFRHITEPTSGTTTKITTTMTTRTIPR